MPALTRSIGDQAHPRRHHRLRAYEREREEFRKPIIALKKRRGSRRPVTTFVFENRDTIRFQIQEMARVEKLISDEAIEGELRAYNPLIPEPGSLSATLFIELVDEAQLREWLPRLVGIERPPSCASVRATTPWSCAAPRIPTTRSC